MIRARVMIYGIGVYLPEVKGMQNFASVRNNQDSKCLERDVRKELLNYCLPRVNTFYLTFSSVTAKNVVVATVRRAMNQ